MENNPVMSKMFKQRQIKGKDHQNKLNKQRKVGYQLEKRF